MPKLYVITGTKVTAPTDVQTFSLRRKDRLEATQENLESDFTDRKPSGLQDDLRALLREVFAPLNKREGSRNLLWVAIVNSLLAMSYFLNEPLVRGWRLEVVKRIATDSAQLVPSSRLHMQFKYFRKGLVLIVARTIYFLPLLIVGILSGAQMLDIIKEVAFFLWDKWVNADSISYIEFLYKKVLPQFGTEVVIQLVLLTLYLVFVWPIYRVIAIKYALGSCKGWSFFLPQEFWKAVGIVRKNASAVYGIYAIVQSIHTIMTLLGGFISALTFGLTFFLMPTFYMVMRSWLKGYAYGILAKKLLERGAIILPDSSIPSQPLNVKSR